MVAHSRKGDLKQKLNNTAQQSIVSHHASERTRRNEQFFQTSILLYLPELETLASMYSY